MSLSAPFEEAFDGTLNDLCRKRFDAFAQKAFGIVEPLTNYEWNWHIGCIAEHLEAMVNDEIPNLIINIPPRTLKSYLVARAFPAWVMANRPQTKFICTSYGYEVAEQNSMACRRIMGSEWYERAFPETVVSKDLDRNMHFETTMAGQYYATSAMSAITGIGCDYMIVDDPVKPNEALSDTVRNNTNANIRGTLFSRFNDKRTGKFLMIMQRLHEEDPTGHLLRDGGYTLLKLPAEAKRPVLITLNDKYWAMKEGDLLFEQRLSREILDNDLVRMGAYNYAGQMLQEPVPAGGGEFNDSWPKYYREGGVSPKTMNIYILCDPAGGDELRKKKKKLSDRTAFMVIGCAPDNNYYWLDGVCDRLNPTERVDTLFELHRKWNTLSGRPPKVGYEKYALMTDTHYIRKKQEEIGYRFALIELGGTQNKNERIRRMIPDMQHGRWWFPESMMRVQLDGRSFDLVREMVYSEMLSFPVARYDDMIDAMSRIYDEDMQVIFPKLKDTTMIGKEFGRSRDTGYSSPYEF